MDDGEAAAIAAVVVAVVVAGGGRAITPFVGAAVMDESAAGKELLTNPRMGTPAEAARPAEIAVVEDEPAGRLNGCASA